MMRPLLANELLNNLAAGAVAVTTIVGGSYAGIKWARKQLKDTIVHDVAPLLNQINIAVNNTPGRKLIGRVEDLEREVEVVKEKIADVDRGQRHTHRMIDQLIDTQTASTVELSKVASKVENP